MGFFGFLGRLDGGNPELCFFLDFLSRDGGSPELCLFLDFLSRDGGSPELCLFLDFSRNLGIFIYL
ncbi:MAG: hypothetical protein AAF349_27760, partial [Cyanobacteria bacterium P01_A01_bin.68]